MKNRFLLVLSAALLLVGTAQAQVSATENQALTKQLQSLKIDVNPRYGTFNPQTASIELTTPGWVKPLNAAQ